MISIILPCYNEEKSIESNVSKIKEEIIKTNKEFKVKEMDYFFEKSKINEKSNFLKTFPNYDQMDGFFGAILVKSIYLHFFCSLL